MRYPHIVVYREGSLLVKTVAALRAAGVPRAEQEAFFKEAAHGDFVQIEKIVRRWVRLLDSENERPPH